MFSPQVLTINIGQSTPNPHKRSGTTGIHKRSAPGPVRIEPPQDAESGSGVAGDFIGDRKNHGGTDQAVYAFQREDLDRWEQVKKREFLNGA